MQSNSAEAMFCYVDTAELTEDGAVLRLKFEDANFAEKAILPTVTPLVVRLQYRLLVFMITPKDVGGYGGGM